MPGTTEVAFLLSELQAIDETSGLAICLSSTGKVQLSLPCKHFLISPILLIQNYFLRIVESHVILGCTLRKIHPVEKQALATKLSRIALLVLQNIND